MSTDPRAKLELTPVQTPRVCVALVKFDTTEDDTETCVQNLLAKSTELGIDVTYQKVTGCNVHMGREKVFLMRRQDHTHVLFIDDDMTFPEDGLQRLLSHNKPVVGGVYIKNREPYIPNVMMRAEGSEWDFDTIKTWDAMDAARAHETAKLLAVDAIGTGFLLVDLRVLDDIPQPWFWYRYCADTSIYDYWSSDTDFCVKCVDAGHQVYADCGLELGHIGRMTFEVEHFRMQREKYEQSARRMLYKKAAFKAAVAATGEELPNINTPDYWNGLWDIDRQGRCRDDLFRVIVDSVDEGSVVVDLGSGPGLLADAFKQADTNCGVLCVDFSKVALKMCRDKGHRTRRVDLLNVNGELDDAYGEADIVVATELLEHFADPEVVVGMAKKLLKPDGTLILSVPNGCMSPVQEPEHRSTWSLLELRDYMQERFATVHAASVGNHAIVVAQGEHGRVHEGVGA